MNKQALRVDATTTVATCVFEPEGAARASVVASEVPLPAHHHSTALAASSKASSVTSSQPSARSQRGVRGG